MDVPGFTKQKKPRMLDPFRRAVLRGLAVLLPPLLTIVIFVWVGNTVTDYLLEPMENATHHFLVRQFQQNIVSAQSLPPDQRQLELVTTHGSEYRQVGDGQYVPVEYYSYVLDHVGLPQIPATAEGVVRLYVERKFLPRYIVVPVFLCVFLLMLYLLGKFLAAGVGRFFWMQFERIINRLPLVRSVYSSVKQVTDFMFSEREIEYTRVVAVEYPRKGIWSLGMVTGESMLDIRCAANEPVLSLLIPTSPMPFTGFTMTVKKSETVDLNITIDQAFQFIVSCGVVVPPHQLVEALADSQPGMVPKELRVES
jgi:uncharacterized membrane protein